MDTQDDEIQSLPTAPAPTAPPLPDPTSGGSYRRDRLTGALIRKDPPAEATPTAQE